MEDEPVIGGGQRRVVFSAIIMAIIAATTLWYILAGRPGMQGPAQTDEPTAQASPTGDMAAAPVDDGAIPVPVGGGDGIIPIPVPGGQDGGVIPLPAGEDGEEIAGGKVTDVSPTSETGFGTTALALAAALLVAGGYGFQRARETA